MQQSITIKKSKLFFNNNFYFISLYILFFILSSILAYFSLLNNIEIIVLASIFSLPILFFVIKSGRFWIYLIALFCGFFWTNDKDNIQVSDVLTGIFMLGSIIIWVFYQIFVLKNAALYRLICKTTNQALGGAN